ncbi:MAG: DUF3078 domain-containing protein [Capnocytophaga sp.]|nr:DUF3078 domain-containing protein [Capnocytophaga sp.]
MKKIIFLLLILCSFSTFAQVKKVRQKKIPVKLEKLHLVVDNKEIAYARKKILLQKNRWYKYNYLGLNMSEVAFSNWNAGGTNSISLLADAKFRRRYVVERYFWDNELLLNYGVNIQKDEPVKKTDDQIVLNSTFGYRTNSQSSWYYSAKFTFNSQIANGYNYPNKDKAISRFMAPGYVYLGIGTEFAPEKPNFTLFLSPITMKAIFVFDRDLANKGSFGVDAAQYDNAGRIIKDGKMTKIEAGFLLSGKYDVRLYENIEMLNRFSFYTEYDKNFGNIDVDVESSINMKVNDYVQARLGIHIKYDDDIKFYEGIAPNGAKYSYGSRIQLKQILGVGVIYKF